MGRQAQPAATTRTIIRVRYVETDAMGVAHHSSYLPWCEIARVDWLREHGHSYRDLEAQGFYLPVTRAELRYRRSCFFDDELTLETSLAVQGRASLRCTTSITMSTGQAVAEAVIDLACVDMDGKPQRLPATLVSEVGIHHAS